MGVQNLHLIYGARPEQVNEQRLKLIHRLLNPGERAQNLVEFNPPDNRRTLELKAVGSAVLAELGTAGLFSGGERRVICVNQLRELLRSGFGGGDGPGAARGEADTGGGLEAGKGGKALVDKFCRALENAIARSPNVLIFTAVEDQDKGVTVDTRSPLFAVIKKIGSVQYLKTQPYVFEFEDALLQRDAGRLIGVLRQWHRPDDDIRRRIFNTIVKTIRLLLQVRVWMDLLDSGADEAGIQAEFFPKGLTPNVLNEHPFRKDKLMAGAQHFSKAELIAAHGRLLQLNKLLYPTQRDAWVGDFFMAVEMFLIELCAGRFTRGDV
ncbi:MAG: hypothetical protein Kow0059_14850 [Candidatus Sumerlaeia bacterium]